MKTTPRPTVAAAVDPAAVDPAAMDRPAPVLSRRALLGAATAIVSSVVVTACSSTNRTAPATTAVGASLATVTPATPGSIVTAATPGSATYVDHGDPHRYTVALTFDLGGTPQNAMDLLDLLAQRQVPATMFAVGTWITSHPEIGRRIVADGHDLASLTLHGNPMESLPSVDVRDEIVAGRDALAPFGGPPHTWFRAPDVGHPGAMVLGVAAAAGYSIVVGADITAAPASPALSGRSGEALVVNAAMHPGAIVRFHVADPGTVTAMPAVLDHLAVSDLQAVTVSELLRDARTAPAATDLIGERSA